MSTTTSLIIAILAGILGIVIGFFFRKSLAEKKIRGAEDYAVKMIEDTNKDTETKKKELLVEAKDEIFKMKSDLDRENKSRLKRTSRQEDRLDSKEESLERKNASLEEKHKKLDSELRKTGDMQLKIQALIDGKELRLEKVAGLISDEAKNIVLERVRTETIREQAAIIKEIESKTEEESEKFAREIISASIQRYAAGQVAESTVSVVNLPNDDMKGRIIGREGRNIRTFETLTDVDLIIDDTPEAVVLSAFDPVRREIARIALEKLIVDGRIHPTRIEEMVEKTGKEVDNTIRERGEEAYDETNVHGLHPELIKILGELYCRTSYGQNVLKHSIEVSNIAGMLASELGVSVRLAKRGGLLHDLGKAIDHEIEGPRVELGVNAAKRFKEPKDIISCIKAHHDDVEPTCIESILVQSADAISAARPGARRESMENYIQRLKNLEQIANSFDGIESSYAIQADREIRIMVKPDVIDESSMVILAKDVSHKIESELEYPRQVKVNVIGENRVSDCAK